MLAPSSGNVLGLPAGQQLTPAYYLLEFRLMANEELLERWCGLQQESNRLHLASFHGTPLHRKCHLRRHRTYLDLLGPVWLVYSWTQLHCEWETSHLSRPPTKRRRFTRPSPRLTRFHQAYRIISAHACCFTCKRDFVVPSFTGTTESHCPLTASTGITLRQYTSLDVLHGISEQHTAAQTRHRSNGPSN